MQNTDEVLAPWVARNPVHNEHGTISCEVEHPVFGWIPFNATPDDCDERGRNLYAALIAAESGTIGEVVPPSNIQALQNIAERRWKEETKGITVTGIPINTERDSQNLINGAVVSTLVDPSYVCNWKTPDGFIQLNASTLKLVGLSVRSYVQACFDREAELIAAVEAGTYTSDMLNEGWPS